MAKKNIDQNVQELKEVLLSENAVVGRDSVLKELKAGKLAKVFMAKNIPGELKGDLEHYASIVGVELVSLDQDNEEVGVLAKKNFFISVVGLRK